MYKASFCVQMQFLLTKGIFLCVEGQYLCTQAVFLYEGSFRVQRQFSSTKVDLVYKGSFLYEGNLCVQKEFFAYNDSFL